MIGAFLGIGIPVMISGADRKFGTLVNFDDHFSDIVGIAQRGYLFGRQYAWDAQAYRRPQLDAGVLDFEARSAAAHGIQREAPERDVIAPPRLAFEWQVRSFHARF